MKVPTLEIKRSSHWKQTCMQKHNIRWDEKHHIYNIHYIEVHYITSHYTLLHYISVQYIALYIYIDSIALLCIALHFIALHYISLRTYKRTYVHTCTYVILYVVTFFQFFLHLSFPRCKDKDFVLGNAWATPADRMPNHLARNRRSKTG